MVGGGHNGLVAAGYLARAGLRARELERLRHVGGAAVSSQVFDGVDVRVSRYSYLVSLLPPRIVDELGVAVRLSRRRFSSYTPDPVTAGRSGLLIGPRGGHAPAGFAAIGAGLLGATPTARSQGAQVKVNMVLRRLPRLRDDRVTPEQAFAGTFHANEAWTQLDAGYSNATAGRLPHPLPCEAYCHSLTDASILSPGLRESGAHTMTVFGLHTPHALCGGADPDILRDRLTESVLASLNSVLAEPIQDVLMPDAHGRPCVETTTTLDLQRTLAMTDGNIFHGGLSWPFAADDDPLDTPARRWGVATCHDRIMLCGSGARRGGAAVSGIGGHNAAMAVLSSLGR